MSAIAWELPEEVRAVRDGLLDFARKEVLPDLEASLENLKKHRERWVKLPEPTRAKYPEIAGLLRQNQDVIMKIIVLDRENEQTLLRKGLVPPKHLPSAKRNQPHYVADLYKRGGAAGNSSGNSNET